MGVAIIDSGGANIASVLYACRRLGADPVFTEDPNVVRRAGHVILPGVGTARAAMAQLEHTGLAACIRDLRQPVLGICLGMQLLFGSSAEGDVDCLGIIPGRIERLPARPDVRIPHMGWNTTKPTRDDALLDGLTAASWFYFVHSFAAPIGDHTLASSEHGAPFSAIVQSGNFRGAQFHPERSARDGARLLQNFLALQ